MARTLVSSLLARRALAGVLTLLVFLAAGRAMAAAAAAALTPPKGAETSARLAEARAEVPRPAEVPRRAPPPEPVTSCSPSEEIGVAAMVGAIFRCRLTEAGSTPAEVVYATAEAVVVAHCESGFDPNAVVFDGQYVHTPHPATGDKYTAAGVFQFIRPIGDEWIEGGYANVHDPEKNIDAAARLYVANLQQGYPPWSDWACAAVNDGYAERSVLPGWPGGPSALPDWAFDF